ncbi:MAG: MATE family efflux transporter [Paludibacteraceae bacterium]|nr:MATE family efflux transporter [Paludibacteraceae bacterium]
MYSFREYLPYYKRNLRVALPVMLTQLGASLVGFFDSIMVGHYATVDLAAVSFSNAIFFTVMVFAMGALMGITPLVGIQVGEMKQVTENESIIRRNIASLFQNGMLFTVLLSALMLLLLGGCIPFLDYFGQDPAVVEVARPYYILIVISLAPFLFFSFFKQFLEGLGNTMVAMVITLVMNGLNILLNWVFIYGNWGFEPMGATGAGLGSLISRIGMPLCFWAVMAFHKEWKQYLRMAWERFSWQRIRELAKIGFPIGGQTLLETFLFTASFVIIGWISKEALAAHQVANQIADMTFMLALGIGSATTIRVSHQLGEGNIHGVRMASNASVHLVLLMNTIGAALMISLRNYIPMLFTEDTEVIAIASQLIVLAGLLQYADGLQAVGAAMLRGITDVKVPMMIAFVSYILIGLSVGLVCAFPLGMGASGIWIGFIFALAIAAICFHIRFNRKLRLLH